MGRAEPPRALCAPRRTAGTPRGDDGRSSTPTRPRSSTPPRPRATATPRSPRCASSRAAVELQPVACFIGGVVAQEIVKHCGKFTPLDQWFHFDCIELVPDSPPPDCAPAGSRYDSNIALFGAATQAKLQASKTFMVAGRWPARVLKNFGCSAAPRPAGASP